MPILVGEPVVQVGEPAGGVLGGERSGDVILRRRGHGVGGRRIVDGLTLSLAAGEIYALLGGNGAGRCSQRQSARKP